MLQDPSWKGLKLVRGKHNGNALLHLCLDLLEVILQRDEVVVLRVVYHELEDLLESLRSLLGGRLHDGLLRLVTGIIIRYRSLFGLGLSLGRFLVNNFFLLFFVVRLGFLRLIGRLVFL